MADKHYLTSADVRKLKRGLKKIGGGTGVPSRRPVATRRRNLGGGGPVPKAGFVTITKLTAADLSDFEAPEWGTGEVRAWEKQVDEEEEVTWTLSEPYEVLNILEKEIEAGTPVITQQMNIGLVAMPACDPYTGYNAWSAENEEEEEEE